MKDEIKEILDEMLFAIGKYSEEDFEEMGIKYKIELTYSQMENFYDYIINLQEKINQYENPDDMTLMFMWCDEKAKDKIKQLQEERKTLYKYTSEKGFKLVGDEDVKD